MSDAYVEMFALSVPENVGLAQDNGIREENACTLFFCLRKVLCKAEIRLLFPLS